jgi:hypothetical protein
MQHVGDKPYDEWIEYRDFYSSNFPELIDTNGGLLDTIKIAVCADVIMYCTSVISSVVVVNNYSGCY